MRIEGNKIRQLYGILIIRYGMGISWDINKDGRYGSKGLHQRHFWRLTNSLGIACRFHGVGFWWFFDGLRRFFAYFTYLTHVAIMSPWTKDQEIDRDQPSWKPKDHQWIVFFPKKYVGWCFFPHVFFCIFGHLYGFQQVRGWSPQQNMGMSWTWDG